VINISIELAETTEKIKVFKTGIITRYEEGQFHSEIYDILKNGLEVSYKLNADELAYEGKSLLLDPR
jgi:hypothetical protein